EPPSSEDLDPSPHTDAPPDRATCPTPSSMKSLITVVAVADRQWLVTAGYATAHLILMAVQQALSAPTWRTWSPLMVNFLILTGTSLIIGAVVGRTTRRRQRARAEEAQRLQKTLQSTAHAMHDSVAQSAAQALWLARVGLDEDTGAADPRLLALADACQRVLDQTREVMVALQSGHSPRTPLGGAADNLAALLAARAQELAKTGRQLEWTCELPPQLPALTCARLSDVVVEATRNMARYAPPRSTCRAAVRLGCAAGQVRASFTNPMGDTGACGTSTGMGLMVLADEIRSAGGQFSAGEVNGVWTLDVVVPGDDYDA
ncbi:Signal transduction histidine kinase, partial [Propionibacterium cyclohexanicum]